MSIKLEVEVANLRVRCENLERKVDNLFHQTTGLEALVAEYYSANLELKQQVSSLPGHKAAVKTTHKPASA